MKKKTDNTINRVREFLKEDGSNNRISFKGMYNGKTVFLITDPDTDPSFPTGLPIYVLASHYSQRFATADETMELMNGAATDILAMSRKANGHILVDEKKRVIVHVIDADLSTKDGCRYAEGSLHNLYRERRKDYVKRKTHTSVDILGYDAYILLRSTGKGLSSEIDHLFFFIDEPSLFRSEKHIIFPYFNRDYYEKELRNEMINHPGEEPADPLILVYDNEMEFEGLLACVNRNR